MVDKLGEEIAYDINMLETKVHKSEQLIADMQTKIKNLGTQFVNETLAQ